ncbi:MAG: peptide chain release factor N(5)-glutamine methyltransferase [Betaproteobacteria bacterium]
MTPSVRQALAQSGLVPVDARVLLAHVLDCNRAWLAAHEQEPLTKAQADAFAAVARRRRDGEPVAYLTGKREFWGLDLNVSPAVLIPRPETETLVEFALSKLPEDRAVRVLDLGTGSGAIALALAHDRPNARVLATDTSDAALAVAHDNAQRLGLRNVTLVAADWYAGVPPETWDLIASNPPYIGAVDPHLQDGDLRFEPVAALSPGVDGHSALRIIVAGARERLARDGWLVAEHGYDQSETVQTLFREAGFSGVVALRDLAGVHRVVAGRSP